MGRSEIKKCCIGGVCVAEFFPFLRLLSCFHLLSVHINGTYYRSYHYCVSCVFIVIVIVKIIIIAIAVVTFGL